jgi:hypothetical protein
MTSPPEKPLREPSILSASTTLYGDHRGQDVRVGVRSTDHSLYGAAAGGHLGEVKRLLESGFNPSEGSGGYVDREEQARRRRREGGIDKKRCTDPTGAK